MAPWWDDRPAGRTDEGNGGNDGGWGNRANHGNAILDNIPGPWYYPPSNEERARKRRLWREGRTDDERDIRGRRERLAGLAYLIHTNGLSIGSD